MEKEIEEKHGIFVSIERKPVHAAAAALDGPFISVMR